MCATMAGSYLHPPFYGGLRIEFKTFPTESSHWSRSVFNNVNSVLAILEAVRKRSLKGGVELSAVSVTVD